jgi:hypothetical protein
MAMPSHYVTKFIYLNSDNILITSDGHNVRDDGQEQYGCTEEEEASQWMVAVAMTVGAYPNHDSHQDGIPHQESIHPQHLPSHDPRKFCQCIISAIIKIGISEQE